MKKSGAVWFFTSLTVLLWLGPAARLQTQDPRQVGLNNTPAATRKVALIIGNGAYTNVKKLKNPPNDAADVAKALKELGFELVGDGAGLNLSQREMKQRIRDFGAKLRNGGVGVFYYAGHGVQLNGHNYLLPVELAVESEADLEDAAVDLQFVFNNLRDASNGLNIVILDACRNNPFEGKTRDVRDGLAEVRAATGTLIAYATAPGSVASDGEGRNGTYTASLLKQLKKPDVEVLDMFRQTREEVFAVTKQKQVPWTNESLIGRFCFSGCGVTPAAVKPATVTTNDAAFELEYWNAIKDSSDPEEYRGYLAKYPNGQFADIARRRAAGARGGNGTATRPTPQPTAPEVKADRNSNPPVSPPGKSIGSISTPAPVAPKPTRDLQPGIIKHQGSFTVGGQDFPLAIATVITGEDGFWVVNRGIALPNGVVSDTSVLEKGTLKSTRQIYSSATESTEYVVNNNQARGNMNGKAFTIDLGGEFFAQSAGSYESIATLPLAEGYATTFRNLNLVKLKPVVINLKVVGVERVTIGLGTFNAYKLLITSDDGDSNQAWISVTDHILLKAIETSKEYGGATIKVELVR